MKTEIAKDIERAQTRIQYDAQCKKVLSNKHILAWIMKAAIKEYSHLSVDFVRRCIEGQPQTGERTVESDWKCGEKIQGLRTEDKDAKEGMITYDIHYAAYLPRDAQRVKILINVEAQRDFYPGYPVESRGVYYGARMLSSQNGIEFQPPYYGEIKKVYSIWVCMNVPQFIGDAISVYEIAKKDVVQGVPDRPEAYDKLAIVWICLSGQTTKEPGFFHMMNTLLSPSMDVELKKNILRNEYQIPMETGLVKELDLMCNLSDWVFDLGVKEGIQQGIEQGMLKVKKETVLRMLNAKMLTDDQILCVMDISSKELEEFKMAAGYGI